MSVGIYLFNLKTVSDILDHPVVAMLLAVNIGIFKPQIRNIDAKKNQLDKN